jgi:hypothetical protein
MCKIIVHRILLSTRKQLNHRIIKYFKNKVFIYISEVEMSQLHLWYG